MAYSWVIHKVIKIVKLNSVFDKEVQYLKYIFGLSILDFIASFVWRLPECYSLPMFICTPPKRVWNLQVDLTVACVFICCREELLSRGCTRKAQCERFRGPGLEKHFKKMDRMLCRVPFRKLQNIMKSLASSSENSPLPSCLQETDSVKGIKDILAVQQAAGVPH